MIRVANIDTSRAKLGSINLRARSIDWDRGLESERADGREGVWDSKVSESVLGVGNALELAGGGLDDWGLNLSALSRLEDTPRRSGGGQKGEGIKSKRECGEPHLEMKARLNEC